MTDFTIQEERLIRPFFTNLQKDVFALINLPEVVKGALFSRYSRSNLGLRALLLKEFFIIPPGTLRKVISVLIGHDYLILIFTKQKLSANSQ